MSALGPEAKRVGLTLVEAESARLSEDVYITAQYIIKCQKAQETMLRITPYYINSEVAVYPDPELKDGQKMSAWLSVATIGVGRVALLTQIVEIDPDGDSEFRKLGIAPSTRLTLNSPNSGVRYDRDYDFMTSDQDRLEYINKIRKTHDLIREAEGLMTIDLPIDLSETFAN
jgi:hypothetical protein